MKDFAQLQLDFQKYLQTGNMDIQKSIMDTPPISSELRLQIYKEAYEARLIEALASNYPMLHTYLGDDNFNEASKDYIASYPSTYRSIRWFGDEFPDFLVQYYDKEYEYLSELAQFEWNMTLTFDTTDAPIFELTQMTAIPLEAWGNMTLFAHPSLKRMDFSWNVVSLWEALTNERTPEDMIKNESKTPWVLWRKGYLNHFYPLAEDEAWAVDALLQNQTFGMICEGLSQWHDEKAIPMRAATLLKSFLQSGFITNISINDKDNHHDK